MYYFLIYNFILYYIILYHITLYYIILYCRDCGEGGLCLRGWGAAAGKTMCVKVADDG
jgi:hypothetical protein